MTPLVSPRLSLKEVSMGLLKATNIVTGQQQFSIRGFTSATSIIIKDEIATYAIGIPRTNAERQTSDISKVIIAKGNDAALHGEGN